MCAVTYLNKSGLWFLVLAVALNDLSGMQLLITHLARNVLHMNRNVSACVCEWLIAL